MISWTAALGILIGGCILIVLAGLPVAAAFLTIDLLGAYLFFGGEGGLRQLVMSIRNNLASFTLVSIPLFILMGELMFHTRLGTRAIEAVEIWIGRVPGRLSLVSVFGGALFSTVSGSSVATTAFLGSQLLPEMEQRGYKPQMSVGPIIGSGGLAMMIPPSALAILLAALMNVSAAGLLIATIVPGVLMAVAYSLYIIVACLLRPDLAPPYDAPRPPMRKRLRLTFTGIVPIAAIVAAVILLIFLGIATPTESAAVGALVTIVIGIGTRTMSLKVLKRSLLGTVRLSVMMLAIIAVSMAFSQLLAFSGATAGLLRFITGFDLDPTVLVLAMIAILLLLGCFMDNLSMVMVAIPIFLPIVNALGLDPMWFAVILMISMGIANLTPPFGLLLFVIKGVAPPSITLRQIYAAAVPFVLCDLAVMLGVLAFPALATFLPALMR